MSDIEVLFNSLKEAYAQFKDRTYHSMVMQEVPGGYAWVITPEIQEFQTTNKIMITKSLNDIASPIPVRMVGGTVEEPAFVSVSAGNKHNVITATLAAGTITYDLVNTVGLLQSPAHSLWIETDQTIILDFNNSGTTKQLLAGRRAIIENMEIRTITITSTAAATNIIIWCDD